MSDNHYTNNFYVHGNGNTVNFSQSIESGSDGAEVAGMVFKFVLGFIGLLLSPVLIPILLAANGVKMIQAERQGGDYE